MKAVCGLDVHKDSIYPCILHSDGELFEQVFGVLTFQLEGYPMRGKSFSFYRGKIEKKVGLPKYYPILFGGFNKKIAAILQK